MAKLLKERLELLIQDDGRKPRAISIEATGKPDAIRDILRNKVVNARSDTIRLLAKTLKTTVGYLTGESDDPSPRKPLLDNGVIAARVVGSVQAGAFMEIDSPSSYEDDPKWMPAIRDPRFPDLDPPPASARTTHTPAWHSAPTFPSETPRDLAVSRILCECGHFPVDAGKFPY